MRACFFGPPLKHQETFGTVAFLRNDGGDDGFKTGWGNPSNGVHDMTNQNQSGQNNPQQQRQQNQPQSGQQSGQQQRQPGQQGQPGRSGQSGQQDKDQQDNKQR